MVTEYFQNLCTTHLYSRHTCILSAEQNIFLRHLFFTDMLIQILMSLLVQTHYWISEIQSQVSIFFFCMWRIQEYHLVKKLIKNFLFEKSDFKGKLLIILMYKTVVYYVGKKGKNQTRGRS